MFSLSLSPSPSYSLFPLLTVALYRIGASAEVSRGDRALCHKRSRSDNDSIEPEVKSHLIIGRLATELVHRVRWNFVKRTGMEVEMKLQHVHI